MKIGLLLIVPATAWALFTLQRARHSGFWRGWMLGIAGALLLARFPFDTEAFYSGVGLLAMSLKLWGTLLLFALCLWMLNTPTATPAPNTVEDAVPHTPCKELRSLT
ncbi:TPA: hypothetical protein DDW35_12065 [Candidatus Sumerlaeota bacterium]|nr:hypothetical protein [Candidatus Sumerlaeota bacterium]